MLSGADNRAITNGTDVLADGSGAGTAEKSCDGVLSTNRIQTARFHGEEGHNDGIEEWNRRLRHMLVSQIN